ncbi:DNA repair protein [Dothidotthia symphoricarpi CBS 119687]|uniref:DNA repair protein REV1 n=1 Tax=Dothidotthia symphoricarpi CBS 119687 TaxID=1392245 RepID=A0A6A6A0D4_9PLEO|nr:DNA repair protein [Dothidotthia symphoricarpi CBS 119687]KAF2124158.1 DNA repair protein [Dothidotthia symphoricarpi CBS 119687]
MGSRLDKNSDSVRKRIAKHTFADEAGDEYGGSAFGGHQEYFRRKRIKLQNLDADIREKAGPVPQIFRGVVAHVNGYTQPSLNDLHTLIVQHGGGFLQYLDGKTTVTHLIASSLTPKKAVEFRRYRIVKPVWVVDSIRAGKLLPWDDYRVLDEGEKQKVLALDKGKILSEANVKAKGYRDQTDNSWYTSQLRDASPPTSTPTPSGHMRSRFSRQRLPTPDDDDIEDLPPSHQPEPVSAPAPHHQRKSEKLVTPPKTSPTLAPQKYPDDIIDDDLHDSLYADPSPPAGQQARSNSVYEGEIPIKPAASPPRNRALTSEEHNAILLRDPQYRKSTVVDPNFLQQYYRESRLHHLSTWKADLKSQLQALASERSSSQNAKQKRPPGARRYVLHVDFDSFFAAVSLKKHPQYRDKPTVVAHGQGNGSEIASCNYPARKYGVKNGMWMKRALELCPDLKVLPYDFPAYEEASRAFYDAILATEGLIQSVSIDEALIDVSNLCIAAGGSDGRQVFEKCIESEQAKADEIAQLLRDEVKARTECNVSVGIGSNILLAKVALRKAKPAGQHQIRPAEILNFVGELQVEDLPGVAKSIGAKLEEIGVKHVKDIRELTKERLVQTLGPKTGEKLWEYARGIDRQEVGEQVVRKSVSAEVNWGVRFENQEQADEFIASLCGELQKRLIKEKVKGKQFTIKVMRRSADAPLDPPKNYGHGQCDTFNKSLALGIATNSKDVLTKEALSMLRGFGISPGDLRGIGLQMTKLEPMKSVTDGNAESSQRRLQFKTNNAEPGSVRKAPEIAEADPIQDDPVTPRKPKGTVDDERVAFGARELNQSTPSRRPLNMMGTQFIMPTQVDPRVLAELPEDIRSRLLRQTRQSSPTPAPCKLDPSTPRKSMPFALTALPAQSQLDPDILAALPAEVRAEIMLQYAASSSPSRRSKFADQTLLPQSPRKNRIIGIPAKKAIIPIKRGRGRPPKSASLAAAAIKPSVTREGKTLTQANFISLKHPSRNRDPGPSNQEPDEDLDPNFLSALPEDLRKEVLAEHKRKKLSAHRLAANRQKAPPPPVVRPPKTLRVPRPPCPTFTTQKLSREKDLRAAMKEWVRTFADEGPYPEDVAALVKYLGKVVGEERDLSKAVGVVKWLVWVVADVEEESEDEGFAGEKWNDALRRVRCGVEDAAHERGMGSVCFD